MVRPYLEQVWGGSSTDDEHIDRHAPRPFLLTSMRVADESDLTVETQVVSTAQGLGRQPAWQFERGDIVRLCTQPRSIAEVSALLHLHLGVVRVLVNDLNAEGDLAVYQAPAQVNQDIEILQRVIRGLRAIS